MDRNNQKPLTKKELAKFREDHPMDGLALVALAAWVNVRPDQLPENMRAHNCPATMAAWNRVSNAIRQAVENQNQVMDDPIEDEANDFPDSIDALLGKNTTITS